MKKDFLKYIDDNFYIPEIESAEPNTTGNINSTYKVKTKSGKKFVLQKINKFVFKNPEQVMENIENVSLYLKFKVLKEENGNPEREVLHPIMTRDKKRFIIDQDKEYWRMYDWIEGATTYDTIDSPEIFYEVGKAFGRFQKRLADYPVENLYEAIPDFHNTPKRYMDFELAIKADKAGRLKAIEGDEEHPLNVAIAKIKAYKDEIELLEIAKKLGKLPIRVAHNDTKINNVMIDEKTGKAICVIDLDTVGPGTLEDYGDAIRSGANKAGEEPEDISSAAMDEELFEAYTRGYLEETLVVTQNGKINNDPKKGLTKNEVVMLHKAPKILTLELAMRFIGDYLNGDEYFRLKEGQPSDLNLRRGLVQLHLAEDMNAKENEMKAKIGSIVREIRDKALAERKLEGVEPDDDDDQR